MVTAQAPSDPAMAANPDLVQALTTGIYDLTILNEVLAERGLDPVEAP